MIMRDANMITVPLLFIICGKFFCASQQVTTSPSVEINGHQIVGQQVNLEGTYVNEYLGIPYAEPPVGPLRFQKPQTFQNYPPVFEATANPPACPQFIKQQPNHFAINITDTSEDCLYLNIWTPSDAGPANKKAVLFWIYGGGFRFQSIRNEVLRGAALASQGDIIVVTVNYRLGVFGFMTTGTEDAPANRGLYDILEGLKWVNKNIEAFGGDSRRITISGVSSGAATVGFFTISPLAEGLYTRLIMESGSPLEPMNGQTGNPSNCQKIAEAVGCANETYPISQHPKEVVQCLRGLDADDLLRAEYQLFPKEMVSFVPQFGDELLPNDPEIAIFRTNFNCKDLFFGFNKDEGSIVLTLYQPELYGVFGEKNPHLNKTFGREEIWTFLNNTFPQSLVDFEAILQHYFPDSLAENDSNGTRHQIFNAQGDMVITCPLKFYGEKCSELKHNVYAYFFTHRPSVTKLAEWMGATHADEVQFIFGQPLLNPEKYKESEVTLSRQMIDIFSNFVKTGIPDSSWPLYSKENPSFKYFGPDTFTGQIGSSIYSKSCHLLRPLFGAV